MTKNLNLVPEIATMWDAAHQAIADAESVLLFGFSFPQSDELIAQLIRRACQGGRLKRVGCIDLTPDRIVERFEECLPVGVDVEVELFPVEKGRVPRWYDCIDSRA